MANMNFDALEYKLARVRARVKQKEVARLAAMSHTMFCRIENGQRVPTLPECKRIRKALIGLGIELPNLQEKGVAFKN